MMENKYYTPEIDEFHIGFEFEQFENDIWSRQTLKIEEAERFFIMLEAYDLKDFVRVKHLDREDIESLGWEYLENDIFEFKDSRVVSHSNEHFLNDKIFSYDNWELHLRIDKINIFNDLRLVFVGNVKNKTELKKLMIQLGINQ